MGVGVVVVLILAVLAAVAVLLGAFPGVLPIVGVEVSLLAALLALIPMLRRSRQRDTSSLNRHESPTNPPPQATDPAPGQTSRPTSVQAPEPKSPAPSPNLSQILQFANLRQGATKPNLGKPPYTFKPTPPKPPYNLWRDEWRGIGVVAGIALIVIYFILGVAFIPTADNPIALHSLNIQGTRPTVTSYQSWSDVYRVYDMVYNMSGGQRISSSFALPRSHLARFFSGGVALSKPATGCTAASLHYSISSDEGIISEKVLLPGDKQDLSYRSVDHTSQIVFAAQLSGPPQCHLQLILHNAGVHTLPLWLGWLYQIELKPGGNAST
jgi:hypothetical protein